MVLNHSTVCHPSAVAQVMVTKIGTPNGDTNGAQGKPEPLAPAGHITNVARDYQIGKM